MKIFETPLPGLGIRYEMTLASGEHIGVVLLLTMLGLEYTPAELRHGLRTNWAGGLLDLVVNLPLGVLMGLLLGWDLVLSARYGDHARRLTSSRSDELLLLTVFGLTLFITGLGVAAGPEDDLGPLAVAYVLTLAVAGSVFMRAADRLPLPRRLAQVGATPRR